MSAIKSAFGLYKSKNSTILSINSSLVPSGPSSKCASAYEKAKVFYDFFHYFLSKNEYLILKNYPLNNHLTLLEKIDNRLDNSKLEKSSINIIKHLVQNDLFDTENDFISREDKYKTILKGIKSTTSNNNIKNKDKNKNNNKVKLDIKLLKKHIREAVTLFNSDYDYK